MMNATATFYKSFLNLPEFRGKALLQGLIRQSLFNPTVSRVIYGLLMELDPSEWTQSAIIKDGCTEPLTTNLYGKILRSGDTYVDVGAHVGFHTLVARHYIGSTGRAIAVEPQPYNCQKIMNNWQVNGFDNLLVYMAAAGEKNDRIALHNQSATDKARLSLCLNPVNDRPQQFQVPLLRLDSIFQEQQLEYVKLLKIDVEGYELEVINGLGDYYKVVENIVFEFLNTGTKIIEKDLVLLENLKSLGYVFKTVEGKPWQVDEPAPERNIWASRQ